MKNKRGYDDLGFDDDDGSEGFKTKRQDRARMYPVMEESSDAEARDD